MKYFLASGLPICTSKKKMTGVPDFKVGIRHRKEKNAGKFMFGADPFLIPLVLYADTLHTSAILPKPNCLHF